MRENASTFRYRRRVTLPALAGIAQAALRVRRAGRG
jgi:hypothetical protein